MYGAVRRVRAALGDGRKRVMPCEENTRLAFRRFIVADRDLQAGHRLSAGDLCFKKIVNGLPPSQMDFLVGSTLSVDVAADTPLSFDMLASSS